MIDTSFSFVLELKMRPLLIFYNGMDTDMAKSIHALIFQNISGILSQNFQDFHPLSGTPTVTSVSICLVHKCHKIPCNLLE